MCNMGFSLACISKLPKLQRLGLGEMVSMQHSWDLRPANADVPRPPGPFGRA